MMRQTVNGSPGLYTAANAEILPPGSLSVAKGVVIRRPGLIQKARPFRQYSIGPTATDGGESAYAIGFGLGRFYITGDGGRLYGETSTPGNFASFSGGMYVSARLRMAEANNNLYLAGKLQASTAAVLGSTGKIDTAGSAPYSAGCPRALDPIMSVLTSGTLMSAGQSAAYRAVYTFTDANGNFVFGAPSGPVTLTATGANDGQAKVLLHPDIYNAANATSYRVQLYRSNIVASGSNPDDEMQLVADYGITSTDVTNKYVTISDNTPDNLKGILGSAYLYTNPGQQTIAAANYQPPLATDLALFKGSMFYANTTQKHRASLTMLAPPEVWAIQSIAANTPIAGQSTYTFLAAVDLTGFDNTMKLAVTGSTAGANDGTWAIVSVNNAAHTVVVTNAGVAQAAPAGSAMSGKLTIGNTAYFPIFGTASVANHYYTVPSSGTSQAKVSAATISLVQIINQTTASNVVAYNVTSPLSPAGEIQLEESSIGGSAFTAKAEGTTTAGYRGAFSITFAPAIPAATPLTSKNDNRKNRLHFSKSGQPEHCPLSDSYYFDIGSASKAILRLIPLRQALLVFKEDGLFRVTGDAGVFAWAPFDTTQILIDERLIAPIQNSAVALTSRGFWQFTEAASRLLSGPVADKIAKATASFSSTARDIDTSFALPSCSASENDGMVYLSFNTLGNTESVSLAYSMETGGWSEAGADPSFGHVSLMTFVQAQGVRFGVETLTTSSPFPVYCEDQYNPQAASYTNIFDSALASGGEPSTGHKIFRTISAVNAGAKTITIPTSTPVVGDKLEANGAATIAIYNVTAVNGTVCTLALFAGTDAGFAFATGTVYLCVSQPIQIDFNPFTAGDDGTLKQFTEVSAIMDPNSTTTAGSVSLGCYTENWTSSQMTMQPDSVNTATTPGLHRIGVESGAQLARHLAVRVTHSNPLEYFYLRGLSYEFEPVQGSVATN